MLSSMACVGAPSSNRRMRGTRNLVLVVEVHDNDRLQLPCFGDHASLDIGATGVRFPLKNCEHRRHMRARATVSHVAGQGSMRMRAAVAGTCISDRVDAGVRTSERYR